MNLNNRKWVSPQHSFEQLVPICLHHHTSNSKTQSFTKSKANDAKCHGNH